MFIKSDGTGEQGSEEKRNGQCVCPPFLDTHSHVVLAMPHKLKIPGHSQYVEFGEAQTKCKVRVSLP